MSTGEWLGIGALFAFLCVLAVYAEPPEIELNKEIAECVKQGKTPVIDATTIKGIKTQRIECQ